MLNGAALKQWAKPRVSFFIEYIARKISFFIGYIASKT